MTLVRLNLTTTEASALRSILGQSNCPGSLQALLINRLDAACEEARRPRRKGEWKQPPRGQLLIPRETE
jgi:hypothetical protein